MFQKTLKKTIHTKMIGKFEEFKCKLLKELENYESLINRSKMIIIESMSKNAYKKLQVDILRIIFQ